VIEMEGEICRIVKHGGLVTIPAPPNK